MNLHVSLSMPQLIGGENSPLKDSTFNRKYFKKLLKDKRCTNVYKDLYQVGTRYFTYDKQLDLLMYYVQVEDRAYSKVGRVLTQIDVWHSPKDPTVGLAADVLLNYFLPVHGKIMSDQLQTDDGMRLWRRTLATAFERNLHVYIVHISTRTIIPVPDQNFFAVDETVDMLWNTQPRARHWRLLISTTNVSSILVQGQGRYTSHKSN